MTQIKKNNAERKDTISLLADLIGYRSTADNTQDIRKGLEHIASLFFRTRARTRISEHQGIPSLLISVGSGNHLRPRILLNGHFDVVPSQSASAFSLRVRGSRAYGRGAQDMKGGLVALIMRIKEWASVPHPPEVGLLITGDEETGGTNGTRHMVHTIGLAPRFVIVGDASQRAYYTIITKEKGGLWLEVTTAGKSAHGARPWLGDNAADTLMKAIADIRSLVRVVNEDVWKNSCTVSVMHTFNTTPNIVPDRARAVLDIRFTEKLARTPEELLRRIRAHVKNADITALATISLFTTPEKHPDVRLFQQAASRAYGHPVPFGYGHAASDARYFAEAGIPTVMIGTVGDNWHAEGEWVDLESISLVGKIIRTYADAVTSARR
mgnify:CR=1 FL=1